MTAPQTAQHPNPPQGERLEISFSLQRSSFDLDIALSLPAHGTTVIFGPSGGGKTTILRAIAGLEPEVHGHVQISGKTWQSASQFLPPHRRRVGFVFQHSALLPHLSVAENLRYGWRRAQGTEREYSDCVEQLDLATLFNRNIHQLSGGERQRVALCRALLTRPDVLLMDEPLAALDAARRSEILGYLERLKQTTSVPVIYVTHAVDEMSRLADFLVLMKAGRVLHQGPALEVMNRIDVPLALRDDAGVVVQAQVIEHDAHGLLLLSSPLGSVYAQGRPYPVGHRLRVRVQARDVSLTLSHHLDSSVLNILPATVLALREIASGQVLVELAAGPDYQQVILARLSNMSANRLHLAVGLRVWAQIKAVALLV